MYFFLCLFFFISNLTLADVITSNLISQKDNVIGVEVLLTQKNKVLLRFIDSDVNPLNDYIVKFTPSEIQVGVFGEFWAEYTKLGFTSLQRAIIPTNKIIRDTLIQNLELNFNTRLNTKLGVKDLFSILSQQSEFTRYFATVIPVPRRPQYSDIIKIKPIYDAEKLMNYFNDYGITTYPKLTIETIDSIKNKVERLFQSDNRTLETKEGWPENSVAQIEYEFTDIEIKRILQLYSNIPTHIAEELDRKHSFKAGAKLDEVLGAKDIPDQMYQLCENKECAHVIKNLAKNIWGPVVWEHEKKRLNSVLTNVKLVYDYARIQGEIESTDLKSIAYIKHFQFILD
jgi:hypothetical protein